jgi:WD40 repeat protein
MGVVYKAHQISPSRLVALKMILGGTHASTGDLGRFRLEAEAVARLHHPNLVPVFEVGAHQGFPYFSMEYVEGPSLEEHIDGRPQPPRQAAALVETVARTIEAVHRQGVIHRDLKPANIMLGPDGSPRVTDFGLAKELGRSSGATSTGRILGTPSYMAPEQATGHSKDVGPATDVYGLGTILYEMLTGHPPFCAETAWDTIQMVTKADPVPPRRLQPTVPRDLETICLTCLNKSPQGRYPSAAALADDLHNFLEDEPIRARPIGLVGQVIKWARRRKAVAALLVVSFLALVTFMVTHAIYDRNLAQALDREKKLSQESHDRLVYLLVSQGANALNEGDWFGALPWFAGALFLEQGESGREQMHRIRLGVILRQCPRLRQIWFHVGFVHHAQFSSDGQLVLTASEDGTARIWRADTGVEAFPPFQHSGPVYYAAFHPDNQQIVTAGKDGSARVWSLDDFRRPLFTLKHEGPVVLACFSPKGERILTASEDGSARLWRRGTGRPFGLPLQHKGPVRQAVFSPNGQQVATASDDGTARIWDAGTGADPTRVLVHPQRVNGVAFHPSGAKVVTACEDGRARLWDARSGKLLDFPTFQHRGPVNDALFSSDGLRLATASDDRTACIWDAATGVQLVPPLLHGSGALAVVFGPKGRWVATASDDNTARVWDSLTGEPLTPKLRHNGSVQRVYFGPEGRLLLTISSDNTARLWEVGLAPAPQEGPHPVSPSETGRWWSPDRRWLATAVNNHSVRVLDGTTNAPLSAPLCHGSQVFFAAFSPNDERLITVGDDNTARIWYWRTGRLAAPVLHHHGAILCAAFSADGRLAITASHNHSARVWDAYLGETLTPPLLFSGEAALVQIPDGSESAVVCCTNKSVWTWDLRPDNRPVDELIRWAKVLSGSSIDREHGFFPLETDELQTLWKELSRE